MIGRTLPSPIELTEADAPDVADLYARCADYFRLQDGVPATLADAHALFGDVPPERDARDQAVLGWRGRGGPLGFGEVRRVGPDMFKERSHRRVELGRRIGG